MNGNFLVPPEYIICIIVKDDLNRKVVVFPSDVHSPKGLVTEDEGLNDAWTISK